MLASVLQPTLQMSSSDIMRAFILENIPLRKQSTSGGKPKKRKNDAFGALCFQGFGQDASTNAPYVKVSAVDSGSLDEFDRAVVQNVWRLMLEHWRLPTPKLLISVTGGAKSFQMNMKKRLLYNFKRGLMKAATSSDAWIVTGGTKTGVMEIVGEAVREYNIQNALSKPTVVIGIATWGIVSNRKNLRDKNRKGYYPCYYNIHDFDAADKVSASLDPNHTHFVLVDNGCEGENAFGGEIGFRAAFETFSGLNTEQGTSQSIPVVQLLLEGGWNTLQTACQAIEQGTPVVVIQGSGRAADFIAFANKMRTKLDGSTDRELWDAADKLFKPKPKDRKKYNDMCVDYVKRMLKDQSLITIIKEDEESGENIDQAIINALIKASGSKTTSGSKTENQLELALSWNRYDVARNEIFSRDNIDTWKEYDLKEVMHRALIEDKDEFVNLFLDSGLDLKEFLTTERLYRLYVDTLSDPTAPPIVCLLRNLVREVTHNYWLCGESNADASNDSYPPNLLRIIGQIINNLTQDQRDNLYAEKKRIVNENGGRLNEGYVSTESDDVNANKQLVNGTVSRQSTRASGLGATTSAGDDGEGNQTSDNKTKRSDFDYTERELFLWSLLFNRRKLAEIFWKLGQDHISGALTASMLLKALGDEADSEEELDLAQDLYKNAQDFEQLAVGVLNACYQKDKPMSHDLLIRELDQWGGKTLFVLADAGQQMDFMEHTCCQTKLNKIWRGKMALYTPMPLIITGLLLPFVALPLIKFTHDDSSEASYLPSNKVGVPSSTNGTENGGKQNSKKKPQRISNMFKAVFYYHTAPVVKFCYHTISYIIFLGLFSFFMLTNLEPYDPSIPGFSPSIAEYVIYGWVVTLWIEEFRQLYTTEPKTFTKKLQAYFGSSWNRFDQVVNGLFIISVILRWTLPPDQFVWARMFYTITLSLYYIRFLQVFYVEKNIGPKVVMIRQMVVDLSFFILILAVFLISYGVAQQALLYPNEPRTWNVLYGVVYEPYFSIYGDFNLDELQGDVPGCSSNATVYENDPSVPRCPQDSWLVMVLFSIYLILTNILLINLLIAMFSYTFTNVQENSEKVWRFYRYGLIREYFTKPTLAPPLIIFSHIYRMLRVLRHCCRTKNEKEQKLKSNNFRRQLRPDKTRQLQEFERSGMYEYYVQRKSGEQDGLDYKLTATGQRLEKMIVDIEYLRESTTSQKFDPNSVHYAEISGPIGGNNTALAIASTVIDDDSALQRSDKDREIGDINRKLSRLEDQMEDVLSMLRKLSNSGSPNPSRQIFTPSHPQSSPLVGTHQIEIRNYEYGTSDS